MLTAQLDAVAKKHPDVDLDINYFIVTFNLLNIGEIALADAVFDRISDEFFTHTVKDHLIQSVKDNLLKLNINLKIRKTKSIFEVYICGNRQIIKMLNYLYDNSSIPTPNFNAACLSASSSVLPLKDCLSIRTPK
jgi:hypothetical protein